jgi:acyl-homoserine-lactone acylase
MARIWFQHSLSVDATHRIATLATALLVLTAPAVLAQETAKPYPERVEIWRTAYGVPHILAEDLAALGYGLAWVQLEDYGTRLAVNLLRGRGELATVFGRDSIESDFTFQQTHQHVLETYQLLNQDTRDLCEGFAAGTNRYVETHPDEFTGWKLPRFTPQDVAAAWTDETVEPKSRTFLRRLTAERRARADSLRQLGAGSNAWAFAPSRTTSGRAILMRNPHLNWQAGYYEAQITVPGVVNFYGDFRIGYPLYFNGGFNENLGWATTNNYADVEEIYALDVDPDQPDHYLFDGGSVPLEAVEVTVAWKNGDGLSTETREFWRTPLGPVIDRGEGKIYVVRSAEWGEYRKTEQFLRMMEARNLDEWKAAMRMRAHVEQNLTYADRQGNIFYIWNGTIPKLPGPSGGDTAAIPAHSSADIWTEIVPFEQLPQLLNPKGGYLQNANDPFYYTNLNAIFDSTKFPANFSRPALGLRSQMSLSLVTQMKKMSLEDVIRLKFSPRMMAAERFKDDLIAAVQATNPTGEVADAVQLLEQWDNTVASDTRGSTLFETWFERYLRSDEPGRRRPADDRTLFAQPWSPVAPTTTPDGLADPDRAARLFAWAMDETTRRFGGWDVTWGEAHRVRVGDVDLPANGCSGGDGCFRVFWFEDAPDGKRVVSGGDGWVLAVEFLKDGPRAYSVLAYGESNLPDSPHHTDQTAMFVNGQTKKVAFTEADIAAQLVKRYRPGN